MNITSKITGYFRGVVTTDNTYDPFAGFPFIYSPLDVHRACNFNYSGAITYAVKPNLVNEFNIW